MSNFTHNPDCREEYATHNFWQGSLSVANHILYAHGVSSSRVSQNADLADLLEAHYWLHKHQEIDPE